MLGHHLEQAHAYRVELAPADDHARALAARAAEHLSLAGRRAADAREDGTASALLHRAELLLPAGSPARRELMPLIGQSLEGTANHARAGEIYEQALAQALGAGDAWVEGRSRLGRAHVWFVAEPDVTVEQIAAETERALQLLQPTGDRQALAEGWRLMGEARMYEGRAGEGRQALERALDRIDPERSPRNWNAVCFALGTCLVEGPEPLDAAVAFAVEQLDDARTRGLRSLEADMLHVLGLGEGLRGRFDNGRAALRAAIEISEDLGLRYMAQWARRSLGRVELAAGDAAAAEVELRRRPPGAGGNGPEGHSVGDVRAARGRAPAPGSPGRRDRHAGVDQGRVGQRRCGRRCAAAGGAGEAARGAGRGRGGRRRLGALPAGDRRDGLDLPARRRIDRERRGSAREPARWGKDSRGGAPGSGPAGHCQGV